MARWHNKVLRLARIGRFLDDRALRAHRADRRACERDVQSDIHIDVVVLSVVDILGRASQHGPVDTPHSGAKGKDTSHQAASINS